MCLLPLIAGICLIEPANLTLDAAASWGVAGKHDYRLMSEHYGGPIGRVTVGMSVHIASGVAFEYGIEHASYIDTNRDRGEERVYLGFTWRPFR